MFDVFEIAIKKNDSPSRDAKTSSSPGLQPIVQLPQFIFQGVYIVCSVEAFAAKLFIYF